MSNCVSTNIEVDSVNIVLLATDNDDETIQYFVFLLYKISFTMWLTIINSMENKSDKKPN